MMVIGGQVTFFGIFLGLLQRWAVFFLKVKIALFWTDFLFNLNILLKKVGDNHLIYALPNFLRVFLLDENLSRNIHATFKFLYICYESLGNLKFTSWASNIGKTEWARLNFRQIFHQNLSFLKDTYFQKKSVVHDRIY